mmetsp:Transcript_3690/g.6938  ORF Transcript_3690/g.6938 Transcript_3690/m.6938 type:complete len:84 (-) Transcript_3690:408-659(-)
MEGEVQKISVRYCSSKRGGEIERRATGMQPSFKYTTIKQNIDAKKGASEENKSAVRVLTGTSPQLRGNEVKEDLLTRHWPAYR